jgi:hypothetical protein
MANTKKLIQAAAGAAGGAALNVEDVFSTYLYDGQSTTLAVNNGIDLATEDGLTWIKCRNAAEDHFLFSSLQNASNQTLFLKSNTTNAATAINNVSQTSTGFSLPGGDGQINQTGNDYASWTFRKAPKFFDVVTYTGDGVAGRTISHNLGSTPGCVIIKRIDGTQYWEVYHRGTTAGKKLLLNSTGAEANGSDITAVSDTTITLSSSYTVNGATSANYVAYLFAHNDGDGEFGPDGDLDAIKCGSYTGTSSGVEVDLGFEPQWVLVKRTNSAASWYIFDTMRGFTVSDNPVTLKPDSSDAEGGLAKYRITNTGFVWNSDSGDAGQEYIYIAIRRGPMAVPTDATDVFDMSYNGEGDPNTPPKYESTTMSYVDMGISTNITGSNRKVGDRLRQGKELIANSTNAEANEANHNFDYQGGYFTGTGTSTNNRAWMWKRAPNYFDVVAYTGNGSSGRTVSHNLGVAPEMMWIKCRSASATDWMIYAISPSNGYLRLPYTGGWETSTGPWNNTAPTDSVFTLNITGWGVNDSNENYIAYLFASLDGVSKVGSVSHTSGTDTNVDCGFSSGARFVLLKATNISEGWFIWDTERGIVSGNDPYLSLNASSAEVTGNDFIDPYSSGFTITGNKSTASYIFYAIA